MQEPDGSPLATVRRIFELLWDAIPFLNAIGDSFQALTDDPADDIASRAAIPAHVRSLLEKAVLEVGELEQQIEALLRLEPPHVSSSTRLPDTPPIDKPLSESLRDAYSVLHSVATAASRAITEAASPSSFRLARSLTVSVSNMGKLLRGAGLVPDL